MSAVPACVLVPVKAFHLAKARLATAMSAGARAELARELAARVVAASAPLPVRVVCDDGAVAAWATSVGAEVSWTPSSALDAAVQAATSTAAGDGFGRVVVAHADLPFASGIARLAEAGPDEALLVADRHRDGTNVVSIPTDTAFRFAYGPGSYRRHLAEASACGLRTRTVDAPWLEWDLDVPDDLCTPPELGPAPTAAAGPP